jgi:hypothetical protein
MTTTIANQEKSAEIILKTDVLGRVRTPLDRREALVNEFEKSGMSGQAFAKWAGINYQTFATWIQKHRKKTNYYKKVRGFKKRKEIRWMEAVVPRANVIGSAIVIHFSGGIRVEVADGKNASEILLNLGVKAC